MKLQMRNVVPRNTKAHGMASEFVKQKLMQDPEEHKPLFKMKAF